jgi:hypothetical protein
MAITINGTANTVAGLAVGGLPDGTVDNDTLANNASDSAEIAAGAVDLAHLSATGTASSSTFLRGDNAWAAAGGGKILQVVYTFDSSPGSTSTSSTSYVTAGTTVDITPSATNSKILLGWSGNGYNSGSNNDETWFTFYRDSTQLDDSATIQVATKWSSITFWNIDAPSSTSAITYDVRFRASQAGQTVYGSHNGAATFIVAMEIGA